MKPYHSIIVLLIIIVSAFAAGQHGLSCAEDEIVADMNQALEKTLADKQEEWITPDTIIDYRSHLKIAALRRTSIIYYADERNENLRSRKMVWHNGHGKSLAFQSYANCSFASVLALSDQRPTMMLSILALLWTMFSVLYFRRQHKDTIIVGELVLNTETHQFRTLKKGPISLTPMQEQLMTMFFHSDNHQLSKQQICDALWPKKPDASDTLYTLIRRIRPILADNGLTITTERGKDYKLKASTKNLGASPSPS